MSEKMKQLIEGHKFFVKESPWYVGKHEWRGRGTRYEYAVPVMSLQDKLYYPVAYVKFMWLTFMDR